METDAFTLAKPYRVYWGWCDSSWEDFATFHEAQILWAKTPGSRIVNRERLDGAEGGNETGLTREERYGLELVERTLAMSNEQLAYVRGHD